MPKLKKKDRRKFLRYYNYKGLANRYDILDRVFDIKTGDIVIDGGSYQGDMSVYFSKRVGENGKVYSFEALPNNIPYLREGLKQLECNNVRVFNSALWDADRTLSLYLSDYPNCCSPIREFRKVRNEHIEVQGNTLDWIVTKHGIPKVDFVWTNIEGSEVRALKGMKKTLEEYNTQLLISTHLITDEGYRNTDEVIEILTRYGYTTTPLEERPTWIYAKK